MPVQKLPLPKLVYVMAAAGAFASANIHYSQPLLPMIGASFQRTAQEAAVIPALTQIGFAMGVLFLLPFAEIRDRRRLITILLLIVAVSLYLQAFSNNFAVVCVGSFILGLACIVPQILPPFAAMLAPQGRSGAAVGLVLSGILGGVLMSRILAGFVASVTGWRLFYAGIGCMMVCLTLVLRCMLPSVPPSQPAPYRHVLKDTFDLARCDAQLRRHAVAGGLTFAAFMVFWSTYAIELQTSFGLGPKGAGIFGIVGVAGSAGAIFAGRRIDRGGYRGICLVASLLMMTAFLLLMIGQHSIWITVLAVLLLDGGVGLSHAANQASAFALRPEIRGRVNSVYMGGYFLGGAAGTFGASFMASSSGWDSVCLLGTAVSLLLLATTTLKKYRGAVIATP